MSDDAHTRPFDDVEKSQRLVGHLERLDAVLTAIDADNWGADVTRRLRFYCREAMADLREGREERIAQDLSRLGTELALQQWAQVWHTVPEWQHAFAVAEASVEEFRADIP